MAAWRAGLLLLLSPCCSLQQQGPCRGWEVKIKMLLPSVKAEEGRDANMA